MRFFFLIAVAALACTDGVVAQSKPDACRRQIPESVGRLVMQKFPNYRLPLMSDSTLDNVEFDRTHGGSGCLFVARGDFNGDRRNDFAVGLIPKTGEVPTVAVALSQASGWNVSTVNSWVEAAASLHVTRSAPDTFKRTEALDSPLERDERQSLRCRNDALIVGASESTGIAYCYVNNAWLYVWISD